MIVIGNEDWLVPASEDERRYAVFNVGEGNKQDTQFFNQMRINLDENGGNRVLLHALRTWDLTTANINVAPKTEALLDQKLASLDVFKQWWLECLTQQHIVCSPFEVHWDHDRDMLIPVKFFREAFISYCRDYRGMTKYLPDERKLGKVFKTLIPKLYNKVKNVDGISRREYRIPSLKICRLAFEKHMGQKCNWEYDHEEYDDEKNTESEYTRA